MPSISFHGAAGTVTGSKYLIGAGGRSVLIDCGMFQGARDLRLLNWEKPRFDVSNVNAVILTHAHIDHTGYLPRLVRQGFKGKVFATAPTVDLASILLLDTAHLQMEDASYRNRKKITRHKKALPLYNTRDAERAIRLLEPISFDRQVTISENFRFSIKPAGHILGAASVELAIKEDGSEKKVLFSGDVGRYGNPLVIDPHPPSPCDYLVCESTYGGRIHEPEDPSSIFADLINRAADEKSVILIPAFAVSRTQQITYLINSLIASGRVPPIAIHIDSPMAISATDIYCKYHSLHRLDIAQIGGPACALEGKNVHFHRDREESKALNKLKGPAIIISASGMMTGGRIMHHLINRLPDPSTTIVVAGFMAAGTIGRKIYEGEKEIFIHKRPVDVRARIVAIHALSGHADYQELLHWLEHIEEPPGTVFVTHGEQSQSEAMAGHISGEKGWKCHIPSLFDTIEL